MKVRRVVTGHTADGKATVASDTAVEAITLKLLPGAEFFRLWGDNQAPTFPDDGSARPVATYFPPVGGFRFGIFTVGPGAVALPKDFNIVLALVEIEEKLPGLAAHLEPDNPGMHTTDTVDFEYVISGEVWLELDNGEEFLTCAQGTPSCRTCGTPGATRAPSRAGWSYCLVGAHRTKAEQP